MFAERTSKREVTKGGREISGKWLEEEMDRLSLSGADIGRQLGFDPTKIYNHIKERNRLSAEVLAALWIEYPRLDMRYILTGQRSEAPTITIDGPATVRHNP
jgi:hypothetical protein